MGILIVLVVLSVAGIGAAVWLLKTDQGPDEVSLLETEPESSPQTEDSDSQQNEIPEMPVDEEPKSKSILIKQIASFIKKKRWLA